MKLKQLLNKATSIKYDITVFDTEIDDYCSIRFDYINDDMKQAEKWVMFKAHYANARIKYISALDDTLHITADF